MKGIDILNRILVAVDGSSYSRKAVEYAGEIAKKFNSELTLIYVLAVPRVEGAKEGDTDLGPIEDVGTKILRDSKHILDQMGLNASTRLETGHPAETIVTVADREEYSLIVIGGRGQSQVKSFLLGSVSDKVSHHAPCPVLIVR